MGDLFLFLLVPSVHHRCGRLPPLARHRAQILPSINYLPKPAGFALQLEWPTGIQSEGLTIGDSFKWITDSI
jgi:hypothetical protein